MLPRLLLTGASSAIGHAMAVRLATRFDLLLVGRDAATLSARCAELPRPDHHRTVAADLADVAALADVVGAAIKQHGPIDSLVHAAGMSNPAPLRLQKPDAVERVFRINTLSAIELCRVLTGRANQNALKRALFISSVSADRGCPGFAAYAAAKAGLAALCRTLAVEFAGSTSVVNVALGPLKAATQLASDAALQSAIRQDALIDPGDAAALIDRLIGDGMGLLSGQTVTLDNGCSLKLAISS